MIYADTSFWMSLYVEDSHSRNASEMFGTTRASILWTSFGELELLTALASRCREKSMSGASRRAVLERHEAGMNGGLGVRRHVPDWESAMKHASVLAGGMVLTLPGRSLDVFHVGIALELKALKFWTFDERQAAVARTAGLEVNP